MAMSFNDAQLTYDGRIPPGVVDPHAADQLVARRVVRLTNIREKPEATRARLVKAMSMFAGITAITEQDLLRLGFTKAELEQHAGDALRQLFLENPTLPSMQWGA